MTTTNTEKLTAAERRCLGNILATGGAHTTGNGGDCRGAVRKNTAERLLRRGLLELGARKSVARVAADRGEAIPARNGGSEYETYYATAAGCLAFGPEVAVLS